MSNLGKGLSALIPEVKQAKSKKPEEIPIEKIKPNPHQPRKHFDELTLSELAESIKEHGILQPLIVSQTEDNYELIAGERRLKAAKKAGLKNIPAIVRTPSEQQKLELSIIENIQRHDLNPIEEAIAYQKLNDSFGLTHEQIAKKVGKSRTTITNLIRVLELPELIIEGLSKNKITLGHAKVILELSAKGGSASSGKEHQIALYHKIVRENLSVRMTESKLGKQTVNPKTKTIKVHQDPELEAASSDLRMKFGTKVKIGPKQERGKIEIEYYSKEELNEILDKIGLDS